MSSTDSSYEPVIPNHLYEIRPCRYRSSRGAWKHISNRDIPKGTPPSMIRVITWNVDFQTPECEERLMTALEYIRHDVLKCKDGEAPSHCCILLQEVNARAFNTILEHEWVRDYFIVTPTTPRRWPEDAVYGNITLVSRSISVVSAGILAFGSSAMQRTALITDLKLTVPEPNERDVTLRVVNTHLESLPEGGLARPRQLRLISKFLKQEDVHSGIVCGDMNAIGPEDGPLVGEVGLRDAWRKGDQDERGFTWGYQGGGDFPAARLDKILFAPRRGLKVDEPERIGVGLQTEGTQSPIWTSDHYGLSTIVRIFR